VNFRVALRPEADADLDRLYVYIRDESGDPEIAIRYIRRIRVFCDGLGTFPARGRSRDDIRKGLRIVSFERRVVITYTIEADVVRIGHFFYGGRDYEALLGNEE
jgi:toxin ParE1/3/4